MMADQRRPLDRPTIIISALVLVIGTSMTVIQKWQKDKQEREELEKEKVTSELSFLKAQINPHFFFNTLNNLYGLIDKDSAQAKQMLLTLSEMMRYAMKDTQQDFLPLEDEMTYIRRFGFYSY